MAYIKMGAYPKEVVQLECYPCNDRPDSDALPGQLVSYIAVQVSSALGAWIVWEQGCSRE